MTTPRLISILTNSFRLFSILAILLLLALAANAQTGPVCITQEAANKCAELARTDKAKDELIKELENKIASKDADIRELKATAAANEATLTKRLHETEVDLARVSGELIGEKKENATLVALIQAIAPHLKKQCKAFSICL